MALKFPCRVEVFHSNVCHGVERSWPSRLFRRSKFQNLLPHQKRILNRIMVRDAVKLYNKYVDEDRLKQCQTQRRNLALAEYYQERFLRNRFHRIKALGDCAAWFDSDSNCSISTVIDNTKVNHESKVASSASDAASEMALNASGFNIDMKKGRRIHQHSEVVNNIETATVKMATRRSNRKSNISTVQSKTSVQAKKTSNIVRPQKNSTKLDSTSQKRILRSNSIR